MEKKSKPVKAWGLKNKSGSLRPTTVQRKELADLMASHGKHTVVRVEIREI